MSSKGGRTKILKIKKGHKRTRDGDPPREGKFPITRKPSRWRVWGKFSDLGGQLNWEEKLNKAQITCLKAAPSRKVAQAPAPATSKTAWNGEEPAAFLGVGTGQKALRAAGGSSFKLWESEGRIDRPEHTTDGSQNKGTEKLQRRAAHPRWR